MKSLILAATLITLLPFSPLARADEGSSCHFHGKKPATEAVVTDCANQRRNALVKNGKLEGSWQSAKLEKLELIDGKKGKEWKVIFTNPAVTDKTKQNLYVFFSHPGNFIATNFTGQ
ncbi:hypothetical protein AZ34_02460 [Hylemonella gracilis str. Niagara R]|uniref:Lipoprotein n=1 Tax=Hylemonella gracilis str. Niagara R TaxID=1458275 RepID=A0A016XFV0_9BURK|nr:DUF6488 family protein [Hylemonella gracilis]EYC50048.1 hypothetical protein AZ34_02460 [Hylemonella gracilis str. Niagara R]